MADESITPCTNDPRVLQRTFADLARNHHPWPLAVTGRHDGDGAIPAEDFLILAAGAGLFNEGPAQRQPHSADPCEVSVHRFVKRDYTVRHAAVSDLERLCELEKLCWQHTRTPKQRIRARLQKYPRGQFVLEKDGSVLGVIYSQRIANVDALATCTAAKVHELHDASGPIVQLLAVNIDPRVQNVSYGDQLLEFMLQRCGLMTGVTKVVGVTLCKSYRAEEGIGFGDYIRQQGAAQDPVLAFHEAHGAEIVEVIPGYRPQDAANLHNGVLVAYDILNRTPRRNADVPLEQTNHPEIEPFLRAETAKLLGIGEREIENDRPLMEMGLDSADLLKLQRHCEAAFGLKLQAGFFFEYSTLGKVIGYLTERLAPAPVAIPAPPVVVSAEPEPEVRYEESAADIAIVGMSCRLPGGIDTADQLWEVLAAEQCVIESYPRTRGQWPSAAQYPGIDQGGFVRDADAFDAAFFRISPAEAVITDPQQRMLLELAWASLEDAGVLPAQLKGSKTGVFVGASNCDYSRLVQEAGVEIEAHHGVGSSLAILANRISYFFDFSGPSLVVDTACSSSLVALHAAMQSLRSGECTTAIAGGVNLICHPDLSIAYHKAGMLAPDGRCKTFDASANGYVRSEGAVVLLLKPLRAAIADRNRIHAVIRGSATNHGGLAGGLTVPNPQKQKELLLAAWKDAGIAAGDLSYIEAHGTGTSLGDPIEIQGIQAAHAELAGNPSKTCAIGSVKSNLGHLESAAGITGLLKVVLALQHRELPASIHFSKLNPKIRLQDSPFVIQERRRAWDGKRPRVGAVSSFGSGGTNAHVVVQEYSRSTSTARAAGDHLFVLSAATEDRLRAYAVDVIDWLERSATSANFTDAIYTLQTGRTAMKHRLAILVRDHADLLDKLQRWLAGSEVPDAWSGQAGQADPNVNRVWRTKSGRRLIDEAAENRELELLGPLWSTGIDVDWARCHDGGAQIISVPTYPFARERYWIDATTSRRTGPTRVLHPLLHVNTSDLSRQSYSTIFSGDEFFLADHQVRSQSVLPGVAYLEMARAAVEHALPSRPESEVLELRNTVWVQPIVVDAPKEVRIALTADDSAAIDFEVFSDDVVHCQGRAVLSAQPAPAKLDLTQLAKNAAGVIAPADVYASFAKIGLAYGASFQGIASIRRGEGQLLAHLRLPQTVQDTANDYILHPSVMDGAVQAAVALIDNAQLPFALESLRVFAPCTSEMFAWVRYAGSKVNIDLCDAQGNVCVQMHGFSFRPPVSAEANVLVPVWQSASIEKVATIDFESSHCIRLEGALSYGDHAVACFERIQTILRSKPQGRVLVQVVANDDEEVLAGLSGLLRTAALENPQFAGQLVLVPRSASSEDVARWLQEEQTGALDPIVRYERGVRQVVRWETAPDAQSTPLAFKDGGVYLITGGLGSLGRLFAGEIAARTRDAKVILTGRAASATKPLPAGASYRQVDLGNLDDVTRLIAAIEAEHGKLDGILHCAGMIADDFIVRKDAAEFRRVLAPKVAGTIHLDDATRHLSLDFFVLFSSIAGAMGNVGQADYATANAFLDHFAARRNRQVSAGQRHGRTRSINWPLWQDGGMGHDAATRESLLRTTGTRPLQTATGLEAFHRIVALPCDQALVVEGDIRRELLNGRTVAAQRRIEETVPIERGTLAGKTQELLRNELSGVLKMQPQAIDPKAAMDVYGIDSILAMKLTNQLEETFGSLPKTLFFEYRSIAELTEYFVAQHAPQLNALFAIAAETQTAGVSPAAGAVSRRADFRRTRPVVADVAAEPEPIAIVGLSGRYPQAFDLDAYWRNLRDGKDCIVEVPKERWDWRAHYTDDRTQGGRHYSKWGGFIEGVDEFDPLFFSIPPREAKYIDPQERLFLQHAWMAIEDAGYTRATLQVPAENDLPGQVGVYVGVMYSEYQLFGAEANAEELRMGFAGYVASIANRVSYALNLHGPSMTLDTMCSSSLTAIHLACQDLKQGRTSMAVAGGVNVSVHPNKYLMLSVGQFISSDGHCQSFGEGGDGYIPGEGVGVVVLKRLSDAKRDGDHIYGVIRGSALNHGGRTNGYTVPNPQAQAGVISRALAESRIDARHISYIEAHGTGTKLGDPIEIAALSRAFQRHTSDTGFCRIGSAKSNIGHCESAAGIAGLTKVLLQMQHKQIVPSLHSAQLNPHIDFPATPFTVNQTLRSWEQPVVDGRTLPRIAGISSFGAGGSNAHIVLEEYAEPVSHSVAAGPFAIVLSARTPGQLQQKAADLLALVRERASTIDLAAMAWTLQIGREAMDERVAFIVSSADQLVAKLAAWVAGDRAIEGACSGRVKRNAEPVAAPSSGADLAQLLELWAVGLELDWSTLHGEPKPRRISLPTYPFARERYWIDVQPRTQTTAVLHPLLHRNVSDLNEQRYRTTFTGAEPFLVDRQVPAVAWLEMARAAVAHALPGSAASIELRDVVWSQPLIVDGPKQVDIALSNGNGDIDFEIFSEDETVHCYGRAIPSTASTPVSIERGSVLDPAFIDSALKAAGARFPVALESLHVIAPCTAEMSARVRKVGEQVDIDLCDAHGNVSAQLRGVTLQPEVVQVSAPVQVVEPAPAPAPAPAPVAVARREISFLPLAAAAPVKTERKKRAAVALAAPGAVVAATPVARPSVSLSSATLDAPVASSVRMYDEGQGIFSIEIAEAAVSAHVVQALQRLEQERSVKVLLLRGIERTSGQELYEALLSFAYPAIAIVEGDATGAGFIAAALCDFMICNEDARYGDPNPTTAAAILLGARFGETRADDLLYRAGTATGRELRAKGWTVPFLPASQVAWYGQQLAATLAAKSQDALRLLKQHLTRHLTGLLQGLTRIDVAEPESSSPVTIPSTARIRVESPAERVLSLTFGIADAQDLVSDLGRIFAELRHDTYYRAVILGSDDPEFLFAIPDEVVLDAQRAIAQSKVPVVAALTRNAKGSAWLIAQFCDAAVYSATGVYSAANLRPALTRTATAVFARRLGSEAASEILLTGAEYSGSELLQRVPTLVTVERDQVFAAATEVAASWARLPRTTLTAWKNHSATTLHQKIESSPDVASAHSDDAIANQAAPIVIPLQSRVVTATAHPDGIVVVKMEDRDAKNMFSDALLAGVREAFAHIAQSPAYKVVILTGYDSYFASGGTKESLLAIQNGTAKFTDYDIYQVALDCRLPVVAAVQGHGIGAGWPMGMFADIVLLSEESQYVSPYMNYGFTPGAGATWILPEKLGADIARESLLTAQPYVGRELRERGVALRIEPRAAVYATAMTLAQQVAQSSRGRLIALKEQLSAPARPRIEENWRLELEMHEKTFVGRADTLAQIESRFQREQQAEAPAPAADAAPVATSNDGDSLRDIAATLRKLLANELQMRESDVDDHTQFIELGLDSISGVTWVRKINEKYQTAIEATKIYSHPTLTQLSRYVREEAEKKGTLPKQQPVADQRTAAVSAAVVHASRVHGAGETPAPQPARTPAVRRARKLARTTAAPQRSRAIAVIGMAGQFPQANDLEEFWQNIAQGKNCITPVPQKRWDIRTHYQPGEAVPGKTYSQWAGAIDGYDHFDPLFFNISPTEAEHMDPQQRLFLQACWHSIENAGYDARRLSGSRTGVFVGCADGDYHQLSRQHQLSAQGFTGSAMSILAARISYLLNLQGPCLSIDTACSSSLVAMAQACDSLVAGSSDLAIAGGVYVMVGPEMHIKTAQAGMLSPEGRCFTFDQRADGFVPGEGVGAVLLKRLEDAERDGDIIHAVIHGWGVNQDGKTNGITAPNPESQTRLQQDVYDKFGIDPAKIQLIEAHGTGTKLGDPIEVEGLRNAFGKYTQDKGYCALGSVKSNIGHCLAAAGIAGAIKLVLALENKQLPPTINFERLNEHIALEDSPFYVNSDLREWKSAQGRLAATSSFGFSGTNAHIVFGEYVPGEPVRVPVKGSVIVPLSAKTPEQLRQKAADLLAFLREKTVDLSEVAYTLQVGREAMDERLGILAGSIAELTDKLDAYLRGASRIDGLQQGHVKRGKESMGILGDDDDAKEAVVASWIAGGKLAKLLELWVGGFELDWNRLYGAVRPRRIVLPLYPFAKERYWIDTPATVDATAANAVLHPLLHSNTSDLKKQRYSSMFSGEEFFLSDHRVRTNASGAEKVLPGAAYLEMARAAIEQASPDRPDSSVIELHDTIWLQPVVHADRRRVSISLSDHHDGRIDYEVHSTDGEHDTVHCQGQAMFRTQPAPATIDLEQLGRRMTRGHWSASDLYALCNRMGLHYGIAHQGITAMHLGQQELLAHLRLPAVIDGSERDYVLHPSLIDSALQASIGLVVDPDRVPAHPPVPFAVETLRIFSPCTKEMVVWVRQAGGTKVDVDLCDLQGNVCVQIEGFASRVLQGDVKSPRIPIKANGSSFNDAFYEQLIADVLNRNVSVDEAVEIG